MNDLVSVDLTDYERALLGWGLNDWAGPASATDALAKVMGFDSVADMWMTADRVAPLLRDGAQLSRRDWTRAMVATEFVWASDVYGSGLDAVHTLGLSDAEAVALLRSVQRKLRRAGVLTRSAL